MTKYRKTNKAKQVAHSCSNNGSCKVCSGNRQFASNKRVEAAMEQVLEDNRELFERLAPHDTRDPNRPGWNLCGCCQHPLP